MDEKNTIMAEAQQLWDQMSEELRSRYPRASVPQLIMHYEYLTMSSWPEYPTLVFSAINWLFGVVFMLTLSAVLMSLKNLNVLAVWVSVLALLMIVGFVWYRYTARHHDEHEAELVAWDRSLGTILGELSDFISLVKGQEVTTDSNDAQVHRPMPPWLSDEIANEQLRLLAVQARDVGAMSSAGVYGQCLMNLTAQVNRACELGVEPISRLGPANGLGLLLEVAHSTPSAAS